MLFNSLHFLLFFPIVCLIYYLIPQKIRCIWLLLASYYFYMSWNPMHIFILAGVTLITYLCGLLLGKNNKKEGNKTAGKIVILVGCVLLLSTLSLFKYSSFLLDNIQKAFNIVHISVNVPKFSPALPIGISFYIFQALGYIIDVYRGNAESEKNPIKYATFIAFFPQLVAGPIERFSNLSSQLSQKHDFDPDAIKNNLLLMLWGFFLKMVIADRIAIFVDTAFSSLEIVDGWYVLVAVILFAFQIYCDFNGYTLIAIGAAGVMGFKLMDNFKAPYCSTSVRDFWSRWHLSLTNWFRDYLYIPLGGNRKGKIRKYINQMIVFLFSGLWHGASWSYVIWGGINGAYLVIGDLTKGLRDKLKDLLRLKKDSLCDRIAQSIITFFLIDFSWLFFRAGSLSRSKMVIHKILSASDMALLFDGRLYNLGLDEKNFRLMMVSIMILLAIDVLHKKGISIRNKLREQSLWIRFLFPIAMIMSILIFGIYGAQYEASAFIYFQF